MPRARNRSVIFHGWWIVLVAFLAFAVNTGLIFYAWSAFLTPLGEAFGGRGNVSGAYALMQVASALYGIAVGRIVDRRGARAVEAVGTVSLALGFLCMSRAPNLPALYAAMAGPVALGSTCIGFLPNNAAVARWFVRKRGRALGISTAGISAGGIVCAPLAQWLIERHGWRAAYAVLGLGVAVVLLPPVLAFQRRDPADLGLLPDGEPPVAGEASASLAAYEREAERSMVPAVAVRQANFWLIAVAFGLTMAGLSSVLLFQIPLLVDRGMPPSQASLVLGATAAMGVAGKLGFGALLDRYDQRRIAALCFLLQAAGVLLLWQTRSAPLLVCFVVLYGYAMGGNATLQASLIAEAFGRLHYGAIAARIVPFVVTAQALGVPATGFVRDHTGGYGPALATVIAGALVAAVVVLRMRLPARPRA